MNGSINQKQDVRVGRKAARNTGQDAVRHAQPHVLGHVREQTQERTRERKQERTQEQLRQIGETLPLFADIGGAVPRKQPTQGRLSVGPVTSSKPVTPANDSDRHMQAAWQLSKALKGVRSGHKSGRKLAKMTPSQRHQVGNAICEHLLASLRQQVAAEQAGQERI